MCHIIVQPRPYNFRFIISFTQVPPVLQLFQGILSEFISRFVPAWFISASRIAQFLDWHFIKVLKLKKTLGQV